VVPLLELSPLSSELGIYKTVKARFLALASGRSLENLPQKSIQQWRPPTVSEPESSAFQRECWRYTFLCHPLKRVPIHQRFVTIHQRFQTCTDQSTISVPESSAFGRKWMAQTFVPLWPRGSKGRKVAPESSQRATPPCDTTYRITLRYAGISLMLELQGYLAYKKQPSRLGPP